MIQREDRYSVPLKTNSEESLWGRSCIVLMKLPLRDVDARIPTTFGLNPNHLMRDSIQDPKSACESQIKALKFLSYKCFVYECHYGVIVRIERGLKKGATCNNHLVSSTTFKHAFTNNGRQYCRPRSSHPSIQAGTRPQSRHEVSHAPRTNS